MLGNQPELGAPLAKVLGQPQPSWRGKKSVETINTVSQCDITLFDAKNAQDSKWE
jgi:hypothetical protein